MSSSKPRNIPSYPEGQIDGVAWNTRDALGVYGDFESALDQCEAMGVLSERPATIGECQHTNYEVLASAIGERLALLGYVAENSEQARTLYRRNKTAFAKAVTEFQSGAGLKPDGWTGKKTWTALGYLVNFEHDDVDHSDDLPAPLLRYDPRLPAVKRAAKLRLRILGLTSGRPSEHSPGPHKSAVKRFCTIINDLGMPPLESEDRLTARAVALLLNHDRLVSALATVSDGTIEKGAPVRRKRQGRSVTLPGDTRKSLRRLVIKVVRIELWLLGYDVDINASTLYPVCAVQGQRHKKHPEKTALGRHLAEFYRHFMNVQDEAEIRQRAGKIDQDLFRAFDQVDQADSDVAKGQDAEDVYNATVHRRFENQAEVSKALELGVSLGLKIWDGMKRLWRWIKKKVIRVIDVGKNIYRAFFRYAVKGFQIVRTAMRAMVQSVSTYLKGELVFGEASHVTPKIHCQIKKDMDTRILISPQAPARLCQKAGTGLQLFSMRFLLACRILSMTLAALKASAASFLGWALLAKSLTHHLKELIPLYRQLTATEAQFQGEPA